MGWKGTMRSMAAAARRYEKARLRELKVQAREQELAYAREVVREYDAYIKSLTSVHRECSAPMDWHSTSSSPSPEPPERPHHRSTEASRVLERFTPGILDRLLGACVSSRSRVSRPARDLRQPGGGDSPATHVFVWRTAPGDAQLGCCPPINPAEPRPSP